MSTSRVQGEGSAGIPGKFNHLLNLHLYPLFHSLATAQCVRNAAVPSKILRVDYEFDVATRQSKLSFLDPKGIRNWNFLTKGKTEQRKKPVQFLSQEKEGSLN